MSTTNAWRTVGVWVAGLVTVGGLAALAAIQLRTSDGPEDPAPDAGDSSSARRIDDPLERAREFYDSRPYYQQPVMNREIPDGLPNVRAETCGSCHEAIYREWKISTHRRAWRQDPQFVKELEKSRGGGHSGDSSDDVGWMCMTCHTPNVRQLERLVVDLRNDDIGQPVYARNPLFDRDMQREAITCASCHVDDGTVYGPWGDTDAPHATAKSPELRSPDVCTDCHQAEAHWPSRNLACFFNTGKQFAASRYARQGQTCQTCHMPAVERKLAAGYDRPERKTRRHWFGGSLIPKQPKYAEEMERLEPIYGSGAELSVLGVGRPSDLRRANHGHLERSTCETDRCRTIWVRVVNANAGHKLPTGDPERHIDVRARARTSGGRRLAAAELRIASKYKWWPEIEKRYDNRLDPGEHLDFALRVPRDARSVRVDVVADKYRMYTEAFRHHDLEGKYVRGREFHRSSWRIDPEGNVERTFLENDTETVGSEPPGFFEPSDSSHSTPE